MTATPPRLLAFGASNSATSINRQLARWAAARLEGWAVTLLDLADFDMPLFSVDREKYGIPEPAQRFRRLIGEADALLISFAEHNGNHTAAFKNLFDWASRIENSKVWQGKPMVILSTSPGQGGGARSRAIGVAAAPFYGGEVLAEFGVPQFYENFDGDAGELTDPALVAGVDAALDPMRAMAAAWPG